MIGQLVRESYLAAAELVGITVQYQDPATAVTIELTVIPQDTEWEGMGFQAADNGRSRSWLLLRDDLPIHPEPGHLVSEIEVSSAKPHRIGVRAAQTYILAPIGSDRVYEVLPGGVLMRLTGKLRDNMPL